MALQFKFAVSKSTDGTFFSVKDTTGTYPAVSTGWGDPIQLVQSTVTSADMVITVPDTSTYFASTTTITVDLLAKEFPVTNEVVITNVDLGLGVNDKIPDGQYLFNMTISGTYVDGLADVDYSSTAPEVTLIQEYSAFCCLDGLSSKYTQCKCGKLSESSIKVVMATMGLYTLDGLTMVCNPPKVQKAINILADAKEVCSEISNCRNCGC